MDLSGKRILLMYISQNSGHHRAALAVEKAFRVISPDVGILNLNAFRHTNPILEKLINQAYMGIIKNKPEIWDYFYDNPRIVKNTRGIKNVIHRLNSPKLKRLIDDFKPDVIACTQAFPCGMVADFKKFYQLDLPLFAVITDFMPHGFWIYDNIDYYIVASEFTKEQLLKHRIPKQRVKVFGIPIDPVFAKNIDKNIVFDNFNLDPRVPVILIMGGGQGLGPIYEVVNTLAHSALDLQLIILSGTNKKLSSKLEALVPRAKNRLIVFEHVNFVHELMRIATLIITKPGGLTTSEALAMGLPMVILSPIPGQETKNAHFLLTQKVALEAKHWEGIPKLVEGLLANPMQLHDMKQRALQLGKPHSARDTAKLMLSTI